MKRLSLAVLSVVVTIVLGACGQGPSLSIDLDPSTIDIVLGAVAEVDVSVSGSGTGSVDLAVSGLPAGVTGSFDPSSVPAGATSSTLTLEVDPSAAEGTTDLTVTATQGGTAASATLQLTVSDLVVTGRVVGLLDTPIAGLGVSIDGNVATTDTDGEFTIDGLSVPYDLIVYRVAPDPFGHVFTGMTTATPEVLTFPTLSTGGSTLPSGTVEGTVPAAVPANHVSVACLEGVGAPVFGCDDVLPTETAHSITATWASGTTATARVRALEVELDPDGYPVAYTGFGSSADAAVSDGGTTAAVNVASYTTVPSTMMVSGTASPPAGFTLESLSGVSRVSPNLAMPVFDAYDATGLSTSFAVPMPILGGGEFQLLASATSTGTATSFAWATGLDGSSAASLPLAAPPTLVSPADAAANVGLATAFSIISDADALNTFVFTTSAAGEPDFAVTTTSDTASIPNLAGLGLPLPSATAYTWSVIESNTVATPDEGGVTWVSDYYDAVIAFQSGGPGTEESGSITATDRRDFTTP